MEFLLTCNPQIVACFKETRFVYMCFLTEKFFEEFSEFKPGLFCYVLLNNSSEKAH